MRASEDDDAPHVITLALDEASQQTFDALRRRYFPPERLVVGAHLTLFHALPADHGATVLDDCAAVCRRAPFELRSTELRSLGRGVAIRLTAAPLLDVHAELRERWLPWLTPQDRQRFDPHITVQNKVDADTARATLRTLSRTFDPGTHLARGLEVWRYRGGPWEAVRFVPFAAP